jgi:tetratricopeptide (TPR) repeat protein
VTRSRIEVNAEEADRLGLRLQTGLARALLTTDADHLDALRMLGDALTRGGEHEDALKVDRHLTRLLPRDPIARYNLACSFSNLKRVDEALVELAASIRLGYREYDQMLRDPDLTNVRRDPRFRKLITRLKRLRV